MTVVRAQDLVEHGLAVSRSEDCIHEQSAGRECSRVSGCSVFTPHLPEGYAPRSLTRTATRSTMAAPLRG